MKHTVFIIRNFIPLVICIILMSLSLYAQNAASNASEVISSHQTEVKQAKLKIDSIVNSWKCELGKFDKNIRILEGQIKKNAYLWSDKKIHFKVKELAKIKNECMAYKKNKFEPGGDYDKIVSEIIEPIKDKILDEELDKIKSRDK
ncbi:MAG: hypothetical protein ABSG15_05065 [FCB group bacterium]